MATKLRSAAPRRDTPQRLQEALRFAHLVHNLCRDEVRPELIAILLPERPDGGDPLRPT